MIESIAMIWSCSDPITKTSCTEYFCLTGKSESERSATGPVCAVVPRAVVMVLTAEVTPIL